MPVSLNSNVEAVANAIYPIKEILASLLYLGAVLLDIQEDCGAMMVMNKRNMMKMCQHLPRAATTIYFRNSTRGC